METVILKNGAEEVKALVMVTMMSLRHLEPIAFYELVQKCKDDTHIFWGDTEEKLKSLALLECSGRPHDSIRNIVLSALAGEGLDMRLVSPIKEAT